MQQKRILLYILPYALLFSTAAICLTPSLFATLTHGYAQGLAETALRWARLLCTCAAALVLMVYAAHAAKNPMEKLAFPPHAGAPYTRRCCFCACSPPCCC